MYTVTQWKQKLYKITLAIVAGIMVASLGFSAVPVAAESENPGLQVLLQSYADAIRDSGATGVLVQMRDAGDGSVKARSGVGNRQTNSPVPWQAHFRTGSTTKTFTATVVLQLVSEGKLSLNDSVEHWLPGLLNGNGYNGSAITVRQLLQHTSGIFDYTSDEGFFSTLDTPQSFKANRFKTYTPNQLISIAKSHPPVFAPGTSWEYSSTNYIIVGQIIKAVTGKSWDVEVKNRIINPLGLTETKSAGTNPYLPEPFAHAYHIFTTDDEPRRYTDTTVHNLSWGGSAGDIITTTHDENRFFRALMRGQLLPPPQLAQMKNVVKVDDTFSYGLGLMWSPSTCDSRGIWYHDGGTVGYSTSNGVTDDGSRSIVVSLSTTTFTDLAFAEATFALRTGLVNDALCYGQADTQTNGIRTQADDIQIKSFSARF